MAEQLFKLSPDRDLQCYFYTPSAVAALSETASDTFTVSGAWRQQFDWAVVEWNRDNVFEHPALRSLPDGNLSGLTLTYEETRQNCIPLESDLSPATVDWPSLRVWANDDNGQEVLYFVSLKQHATPVDASSYRCASGVLTLTGTGGGNERVGVCFPVNPNPNGPLPEQHAYVTVTAGQAAASIADALAAEINRVVTGFTAARAGDASSASIAITWVGYGDRLNKTGSDGNKISVCGFVTPGSPLRWTQPNVRLSKGQFPQTYRLTFDFANLYGSAGQAVGPLVRVPTNRVRKLRWTWAAAMQAESYQKSEFTVTVTNWSVTGSNRLYQVAGPGSRRIENDDPSVKYSGSGWQTPQQGNYSGNYIAESRAVGDVCEISYQEPQPHQLYLGSQLLVGGGVLGISVDGGPLTSFSSDTANLAGNQNRSGDQTLLRIPLGSVSAGRHTVSITHVGGVSVPSSVFIDYLEIVYPTPQLPEIPPQPQLALATDWDTYHSQSIAPERTAWMIQKLGFHGRVNHYVGAIWFYELVLTGHSYASATITIGTPQAGPRNYIELQIGPQGSTTPIRHYNLDDDTPETVALALANTINQGGTAIWAAANGSSLTVTLRQLTPKQWTATNPSWYLTVTASTGAFSASPVTQQFSGGNPGIPYDTPALEAFLYPTTQYWRVDTQALPSINRAARDWSRSFFRALASYGLDAVASFSTELLNADPSAAAGLAQRQFDGTPLLVATPAVQTNFSPTSRIYWQQVYVDMARTQFEAGMVPYLQSGEVQYWYFASGQWPGTSASLSMPFYDDYTKAEFRAKFNGDMRLIPSPYADPAMFTNEVHLLSDLLAQHTAAIRAALHNAFPNARYEVLYPTDLNETPLNQTVNFAASDWTPSNLTCLKTECLSYTTERNLDGSRRAIELSSHVGFPASARSHLVWIADTTSSWRKEIDQAHSANLESIVLFALDQYCLIGYPLPPFLNVRRSASLG